LSKAEIWIINRIFGPPILGNFIKSIFSDTKKLKRRKRAVRSYLQSVESLPRECPIPSIGQSLVKKDDELSLNTSDESELSIPDGKLKTDLSDIEKALKKLESTLD